MGSGVRRTIWKLPPAYIKSEKVKYLFFYSFICAAGISMLGHNGFRKRNYIQIHIVFSFQTDLVFLCVDSSLALASNRKIVSIVAVLGNDITIVQAVVRLSAPATTPTHSQVIRLRRVLADHPLQWT